MNRQEALLTAGGRGGVRVEGCAEGRAKGPSAIGDGGQAAISLTPDTDGMHVCIFEKFKT